MKVAMSAAARGWREVEYRNAIAIHGNGLWSELLGERRKLRSPKEAYRQLETAWQTGVANVQNVGFRSKEEVRDDAVELAYQWADYVADESFPLSTTDRIVMRYVIEQTEKRRMLKVTCPRMAIAEYGRISGSAVRAALDRLTRKALLVKYSAGKRAKEPEDRRAAIYGLPPIERAVEAAARR